MFEVLNKQKFIKEKNILQDIVIGLYYSYTKTSIIILEGNE